MITIVSDSAFFDGRHCYEFRGLSTDTKPQGKINGSKFIELDTGTTYWYNEDSGGWIAEATKYLSSIAVTTQPTKTEYTVGETFSKTGMVVKATYTDNSTATVSTYTTAPTGELTVDDTTITITYSENGIVRTTTVTITVSEDEGTT